MPDMYRRPYLDTSVYLALVRGSPPEPDGREAIARNILSAAIAGEYPIVASTFLKVEVLGVETSEHAQRIDEFFQHRCFEWYELDMLTAEQGRDVARKHGIHPADAVHLATAIRAGCDQLLRWDDRFHPGIYEGVTVTEPWWAGQEQLIPHV
jgi:predicted nucleic acid-binding protein